MISWLGVKWRRFRVERGGRWEHVDVRNRVKMVKIGVDAAEKQRGRL
jgi:hypothetical protein